ncbi:DUF2946 family protein [Methyloversatilis sp. XJ19-13]|uniref:DUF2946 family protein n=1 Tax=Methyloversatilis sp. XJ19-13 TaxID=2963430 RepID=UPI003593BF28
MTRSRYLAVAWLLVLVSFAAAVLPPIVHARLHEHGADATSLLACAQYGVKLAVVPRFAEGASSADKGADADHCPFCMHACLSLPPTHAWRGSADPAGGDHPSSAAQSDLRAPFAWLRPATRAPPVRIG